MCVWNILKYHQRQNKDDFLLIKKVLKNRKELPEISHFAIQINCDPESNRRVNFMIDILKKCSFTVRLIESVNKNKYFIVLELS
jgi:hypothetical protein